jgi:hypothetical protein
MAKYVMSWKVRSGGTAKQNHDDGKKLLDTLVKSQPVVYEVLSRDVPRINLFCDS